jgi:hypothetical protein
VVPRGFAPGSDGPRWQLLALWKGADLLHQRAIGRTRSECLTASATSTRQSGARCSTSNACIFSRRLACEDTLPGGAGRAELVFYQLGKFSQVISDYEQIHFITEPKAKYRRFADWFEHQAPGQYADADTDVGYATPDAVTISTAHQSKGLQWPATSEMPSPGTPSSTS